MIKVSTEKIIKMNVDAIVNAANIDLAGGGGVDGAIHQAAGTMLDEACKKIGYCDVGGAVITSGYNLKAKYIIHTVGPIYNDYDEDTNEELLSNCYINSLSLAKQNNIHSIAFPCISAGIYGYPLFDSAVIAYRSVRRWLYSSDYQIDVYFVCFNDNEYKIYKSVVPELNDKLIDEVNKCLEKKLTKTKPKFNIQFEKEEIIFKKTLKHTEIYECSCDEAYTIDENIFKELDESFSEMLLRKIDEKGIKDSDCYNKANIDRRLFSKIRSNKEYRPSKQTVLAFAIALELPIKETNEFLRKAGFAFSDSDRADIIVRHFIRNKIYNINIIDETLLSFDQKPLTNY